MRELVDYFLLKTGRRGITASELSALRALDEGKAPPSRISREINTALKREQYRASPHALTLEYIRDALKYQYPKGGRQQAAQSSLQSNRNPERKDPDASDDAYQRALMERYGKEGS